MRKILMGFVLAFAACAVWAADSVTNKLNGVTLRGDPVANVSFAVKNTDAVDFASWTNSTIRVQPWDVVVASFVASSAPSRAVSAGHPVVVKFKTKSSPEWAVTGERRAFVTTEDAPLMYASTAGADVTLTIEVRRNSALPPPAKHGKKNHLSPAKVLKRM